MIPPGQAGKVEATMKTTELRGQVNRSITLKTNDPAKPVAYLTLRTQVAGSVILLPQPQFSVGSARGSGAKRRMIVRKDPRESAELVVSEVRGSQPWIAGSARRVEQTEPGSDGFPTAVPGDWIVEVDLTDGHPSGVHRERLRFATGLELEPEVEVPVIVSVIPPVVFRPAEVALHSAGSGFLEGEVVAVVGASRAGQPLEVHVTPESLEASIEQTGPRHYRVHVRLPEEARSDFDTGTLVLQLGDHREEIPVWIEGSTEPAP